MNITELATAERKENMADVNTMETDKPGMKQVQVLIHTRDALDESAVEYVMQNLNHVSGVSDLRYNPAKNHLLIVSYDPHTIKPVQLLNVMRKLGHQAQLVGL